MLPQGNIKMLLAETANSFCTRLWTPALMRQKRRLLPAKPKNSLEGDYPGSFGEGP